MELTKQDKKHIQEQVDKINLRIVDEAKEYSRLYERTFYETLIDRLRTEIAALDVLSERIKEMTNRE